MRTLPPATVVLLSSLCIATFAAYDLSEPQVAVNGYDTCFTQFGQSVCWGRNNGGQLGIGNTEDIGDEANEIGLALYPIDLGPDFIVKQLAGGSGGPYLCYRN